MNTRVKELEQILDVYSSERMLNSNEAKQLLDEYYHYILHLMNELNGVSHEKQVSSFTIKPLNYDERIQYINERKYHFMGYQQMKTMINELNKLIAVQHIKKKRQQ
ncbi:YpoC family protein [Macrococcoides caseolyticum]|uniref:YpoC family protein n=1 Tax=Macrococcoides caseolyticum TaxID=69966 RepID=UPI001F24A439|nr:hypothetical protein [Macrococcus caseolyticus]MCE4957047.1 hypothetical protein [Macrococcus caseolyticus]